MKYRLLCIILAMLVFTSFCGAAAEDIVVIFTNDVHCGFDKNLGYSTVAGLKEFYKSITDNVLLVDSGDAIQGEVIGAISRGDYIIDFMNAAGYDYSTLGNHEFDYGLDQLAALADKADFQYVACNIVYTGTQTNKLNFVKPYVIHDFGETQVGIVGVATPDALSRSKPTYFQEDGEFVYDFGQGEKGAILYGMVQNAVDAARAEGADYVILLSHLGTGDESAPYRSIDVKIPMALTPAWTVTHTVRSLLHTL